MATPMRCWPRSRSSVRPRSRAAASGRSEASLVGGDERCLDVRIHRPATCSRRRKLGRGGDPRPGLRRPAETVSSARSLLPRTIRRLGTPDAPPRRSRAPDRSCPRTIRRLGTPERPAETVSSARSLAPGTIRRLGTPDAPPRRSRAPDRSPATVRIRRTGHPRTPRRDGLERPIARRHARSDAWAPPNAPPRRSRAPDRPAPIDARRTPAEASRAPAPRRAARRRAALAR